MDQLRATTLPASRAIFQKSTTNGNSSSSPAQSSHHTRSQPAPPQPRPSDIVSAAGNSGTQQTSRPTPPPQATMSSTASAPNPREKISESSSSTKARHSGSNGELQKSDKAIKGGEDSTKGLTDSRRPSRTFNKGTELKASKSEQEHKVDEKQQIKEMIDIFINRSDLLPGKETTADHIVWRKEEANRLENDKANKNPKTGGLFRGCFREQRQPRRWHGGVLRDEEDGVDRCPDCMWELEGRYCSHCDFTFQDDGTVTRGSHWGRFSDIDDAEDSDGFGDEDLDGDLDLDETDSLGFGIYDEDGFPVEGIDGEPYDEYMDYHTSGVYAIQREIARGSIRPPVRRAAAHSAAGSRRRYSQSMVSDMQTSEDGEMEPLAEESEEESESMRDFIVDDANDPGQRRGSQSSRSSSLATQETPQSRRLGRLGLRNRVTQSPVVDDDDDFDEGGAVSNGRRLRVRRQYQPPRRLGRRGPIALSTSTETEEEGLELDEDTEALLNSGYSQLDHDTPEEDMESEQHDDDDDEDAATTIGVGSTSFTSSERARLGGSLTPTAGRPNPPIRPPSRTQNGRRTNNRSRGLRLRRVSSSISTTSTVHYEDGEADDDESDIDSVVMDADGDIEMNGSPPRARRGPHSMPNARPGNRRNQASEGTSAGDAIDLDTDVSSDTSVQTRRPRQRSRQREYDPRISMLFAEHQITMREQTSASLEAMMRGRTPTPLNFPNIPRPRTANRNRVTQSPTTPPSAPPYLPLSPGPIPPFSPISVGSGHSRNSSMSSAPSISLQGGSAPYRQPSETPISLRVVRSSTPSGRPSSSESNTTIQTSTAVPRSPGGASTALVSVTTPARASHQPPNSNSVGQQGNTFSPGHIPESSTGGGDFTTQNRRDPTQGDASYSPPQPQHFYQTWGSQSPGFNLRMAHNPWAASFATVRPRPSNRTLRGAPSNETIRGTRDARSQTPLSQGREATTSPHPIRSQPSQHALRGTRSRQTLRSQTSNSHIRRAAASPSPLHSGVGATVAGPRNAPLSQEEKSRRGREVVLQRQQELLELRQQENNLRLGLAGQANGGAGQQQQNQQVSTEIFSYRRSYSAPVSNGLGFAAASSSLPNSPGNPPQQSRGFSEAPSGRAIPRPNSRRAMVGPGMVVNTASYSSPPPNIPSVTRSGTGGQNYTSQLNVTSSLRANPMIAGGEPRRFQ